MSTEAATTPPSIEDIQAELEAIVPEDWEPDAPEPEPEPEPPQADPIESLAEEMGWRKDFNGREAVSAKEYIKRQQGFLRDSSRQLRELKEATAKHGEQLVRIQKQALEDARRAAQAELDEAVRMGDTRAAAQAVEKLTAAQEAPQTPQPPRIDPDVETFVKDWVGKNDWFSKDEEAVAYSDVLYRREIRNNGGVDDPVVILPKIEAAIRKRFPEHFDAPEPEPEPPRARTPAPSVNGTPRQAQPVGRTATKGWNDIEPAIRQMAREVVTNPGFRPDLKTMAEKQAAYASAYFKSEER